jgi:hypothetical protein
MGSVEFLAPLGHKMTLCLGLSNKWYGPTKGLHLQRALYN